MVSNSISGNSEIQNTSMNANVTTLQSQDRPMSELLQLSETVAKSKAAILIQGEAGSGKKSLAQFIHQKSQRVHKTIQSFNCAELSVGEQEATFFQSLERAHGGTFLLIEISKLATALQSRLLQVLQEGLFLKPGTLQALPIDVRIIATSTLPLSQAVKTGQLREDLFFRLNVVNLKIPSLSDRLGDVEYLARSFAKKWGVIHGKGELQIAAEAIQLLNGHRFNGNIRELDQTLERAVLFCNGTEIRAKDIQIQSLIDATVSLSHSNAPVWKLGKTLTEIERNVILEALKHFSGNRTHTAKALGISIRTLRNKLAEYRVMGIHA